MDSVVHSTDQRHFVLRQNSRHVGLGQSERLLVRLLNADLEPQLMAVHIAQVFDVQRRTHTHTHWSHFTPVILPSFLFVHHRSLLLSLRSLY